MAKTKQKPPTEVIPAVRRAKRKKKSFSSKHIDDAERKQAERLRQYGPPSRRELNLHRKSRYSRVHTLYQPSLPAVTAVPKVAHRGRSRRVSAEFLSTNAAWMESALVKNNGGQWYLASSRRYTAWDLERRFAENAMPWILYEAVGGILGSTDATEGYMYLQILENDPNIPLELVRQTLKEMSVRLNHKMDKVPLFQLSFFPPYTR